METPLIDILQYAVYRMFLKDIYAARKKRNRAFSYRSFAMKAGTAPSLLADIIEGRRALTLSVMEKFAKALGLTDRETRYFGALVRFVNAKTSSGKNDAFAEMSRLRRQSHLRFLRPEQYEFWSQWYHAAIREMTTLPGFKEDPEWIARHIQPHITPSQARKSLETLQQLGLLKRDLQGRLTPCDPAISSEYEVPSLIVRQFNQEMIAQGLTAADRFDPDLREIGGLTLGLSRVCYDRIKQRIRIFKEEILSMVIEDKTDSEMVAQLNIQLFPMGSTLPLEKGSKA